MTHPGRQAGMTRLDNILLLALAVQLLLAVAVFWPRQEAGQKLADTPLLSIESADIDRVSIDDTNSAVVLVRDDDGWTIPDYHDLPVSASRIETLLETLPNQERGWPVASSAGAVERFEVGEDNFQRKIEYFEDGDSADILYLGTSPGFRKIHVRPTDSNTVYSIKFNAFDAPTQPAEWLEKTLLQVKEDIQSIRGLDYGLSRSGEAWVDAQGNTADEEEARKLLNGMTNLRVTAATDEATAAILQEMDSPPNLTVSVGGGVEYRFRLFEIEDAHYIQRTDMPVHFSLSAYDYNRINDVNAASLFPPPPPEEEAEPEGEESEDEG